MKDKIILFVIGVLVGAIISTGAFVVYTKMVTTCDTNSNNQIGMRGGNPPSMQDGQNAQPPEKPGENSTQNNNNSQSDSEINNN